MADTKISALTSATPVGTDETVIVDDPGGSPSSKRVTLNAILAILEARLASTSNGEGASEIGIEDAAGNLTATNVEAAIAEIFTLLASTSNGEGASLVGVEDSEGRFSNGDVEAVLAELDEAIQTLDTAAQATYLQDSDLTIKALDAGGSASTTRPTFSGIYVWYNTPSEPTNLGANDIWIGNTKDTIVVPANAMTPTTTAGAEVVTRELATNDIMIEGLAFDGSSDEHAMFWVPMPVGWDEGTVTAQFTWTHNGASTNFGVAWAIQGLAFSDGDAGDAAMGTAVVTTDTGGTNDDIYITAESSAITIGGTPAEGDTVAFKVYRDVSDGGDTMATDADLIAVRLTFTRDSVSDE